MSIVPEQPPDTHTKLIHSFITFVFLLIVFVTLITPFGYKPSEKGKEVKHDDRRTSTESRR